MLWKKNKNKNYVNWSNYRQKIEFMNEFYFEQAQLKNKI